MRCPVRRTWRSGFAEPAPQVKATWKNRHVAGNSAAAYARSALNRVRDDLTARFTLMRSLYEVPREVDRGYLPYRRAATAFMNWQMRRGLLNPSSDRRPGSPWWRAVNEGL